MIDAAHVVHVGMVGMGPDRLYDCVHSAEAPGELMSFVDPSKMKTFPFSRLWGICGHPSLAVKQILSLESCVPQQKFQMLCLGES